MLATQQVNCAPQIYIAYKFQIYAKTRAVVPLHIYSFYYITCDYHMTTTYIMNTLICPSCFVRLHYFLLLILPIIPIMHIMHIMHSMHMVFSLAPLALADILT